MPRPRELRRNCGARIEFQRPERTAAFEVCRILDQRQHQIEHWPRSRPYRAISDRKYRATLFYTAALIVPFIVVSCQL